MLTLSTLSLKPIEVKCYSLTCCYVAWGKRYHTFYSCHDTSIAGLRVLCPTTSPQVSYMETMLYVCGIFGL